MYIKFLLFALILISNNICDDYFIHYLTDDIPCSVLTLDNLWIRCIINQTNPLQFLSKTILSNVNIEFVFISIDNFTLSSNFFLNDYNYSLIVFDTTENIHIKQLNILINTFSNLFSTKIYFYLHHCGYPILQFEPNVFHYNLIQEIMINYNNRTVLLTDYFSNECLIDNQISFINENKDVTIVSYRKQPFNSMKLIANSLLFSIMILMTSILMCLVRREPIESLADDILHSGRTSTNEPTISVISHIR